jgi:hypothetical protein
MSEEVHGGSSGILSPRESTTYWLHVCMMALKLCGSLVKHWVVGVEIEWPMKRAPSSNDTMNIHLWLMELIGAIKNARRMKTLWFQVARFMTTL